LAFSDLSKELIPIYKMLDVVTVATYTLPHELVIDKSKLESNDIECFVKDEMTVQVHNFLSNAIGGVKLQVLGSDLEKARAILSESNNLVADCSDATLTCTNCNSGNITGVGLNGKISLIILLLTGIPIPIFSSKFKCFDCDETFKPNKKTRQKAN